ncbi:hypothetical protein E4J89_03950 [Arthrobacter sp. CAU 1506]|uniref:hypothetical protein n=1 Tax=Arthrobacter sp. CAU 1506 TaxID=2560052 RepID=UPI0010AB7561|nr:hypothetical protein [Arthrobacter sp. CAU 1506]TJY71411.1 hypothetical protein E4J89_03950 [Arthrobacter sp. CAU 1506]
MTTTVDTQPFRPASSASFNIRPSAFESFLIHSGRALVMAGEHRARRKAALGRLTPPRHVAPAMLLRAHEALRTDVQAAAQSGIHAR